MIENTTQQDDSLSFDRNTIKEASHMMKLLSHPIRLLILCLLSDQADLRSGEIVAALNRNNAGYNRSQIAQYLSLLKQEGLVETQRRGRHVHYKISSGLAEDILKVLHGYYCSS
mgnify:CR=1 FL=1